MINYGGLSGWQIEESRKVTTIGYFSAKLRHFSHFIPLLVLAVVARVMQIEGNRINTNAFDSGEANSYISRHRSIISLQAEAVVTGYISLLKVCSQVTGQLST